MADVHEPHIRSYNMSRIRSKDTKPEIHVRKFLHKQGFRFRLHQRNLPGRPDIVLARYKTAIFIHGCFWHGHDGCKYFILPKTNAEFWAHKIGGNKERDRLAVARLKKEGWQVIEIWECDIRSYNRDKLLSKLTMKIKKKAQQF
jgi:DNA mismatch endonuclease, patch repair protein